MPMQNKLTKRTKQEPKSFKNDKTISKQKPSHSDGRLLLEK